MDEIQALDLETSLHSFSRVIRTIKIVIIVMTMIIGRVIVRVVVIVNVIVMVIVIVIVIVCIHLDSHLKDTVQRDARLKELAADHVSHLETLCHCLHVEATNKHLAEREDPVSRMSHYALA